MCILSCFKGRFYLKLSLGYTAIKHSIHISKTKVFRHATATGRKKTVYTVSFVGLFYTSFIINVPVVEAPMFTFACQLPGGQCFYVFNYLKIEICHFPPPLGVFLINIFLILQQIMTAKTCVWKFQYNWVGSITCSMCQL
jgi:hypothetical protein